jgi:hypothetical protein
MPSINTGGFQATVMPGIQYLQPQMFTPNYGDAVPNQSAGAKFYSQLKGIAEDAQMAPLRKRLQELAVAQGEQGLLNTKQTAAFGHEVITSEDFLDETRDGTAADVAAVAEGEDNAAPQKVWGNLYKVTKGYRIGPGGIMEPFERKTVVENASDRELKDLQFRALAQNRLAVGNAATVRAATAEEAAQNGHWKIVSSTTDAAGNLVINKLNPVTNELVAISTNQKRSLSPLEQLMLLGRTPDASVPPSLPNIGAAATPPSAAAMNVIGAGNPMFKLDMRSPEVKALDPMAGTATVPVADLTKAVAPKIINGVYETPVSQAQYDLIPWDSFYRDSDGIKRQKIKKKG